LIRRLLGEATRCVTACNRANAVSAYVSTAAIAAHQTHLNYPPRIQETGVPGDAAEAGVFQHHNRGRRAVEHAPHVRQVGRVDIGVDDNEILELAPIGLEDISELAVLPGTKLP
jgi:hypothetical protein